MDLQGERLIPARVEQTWAALNDPAVLKACIAGCESMERTAPDALTAVVAMKIGPVSARFKGVVTMSNVRAPNGYTLNFDGQGGAAGFGKGSADVALASEGPHTRLTYSARATVGGKMAQIGSRLVDATAAKLAEDFFKAFEAQLTPAPVAPTPAAAADAAMVAADTPSAAQAGGVARLWWLIGAVVLLAIIYFAIR